MILLLNNLTNILVVMCEQLACDDPYLSQIQRSDVYEDIFGIQCDFGMVA